MRRPRDFTSISQSFTTGQAYREFSAESHATSATDFFTTEEQKQIELESAIEEKEKSIDQWKYSRTADAAVLYDSNLAGRRIDPQDELIQNYHGNFRMARRSEYTYVNYFYDVAHSNYTVKEKENDLRHEFGQSAGLTLGRLSLGVSNTFSPRATFATGERTELEGGAAGPTRVTALTDSLAFSAKLKISPKLSLSSSYTIDVFSLPASVNSEFLAQSSTLTRGLSGQLEYKWRPKMTVGISGSYTSLNYFKGGLFTSHDTMVSAFVTGSIRSMSYRANGSYKVRNYQSVNINTLESLNGNASLSKKLTPKIAATVSANYGTTQRIFELSQSIPLKSTFYGIDLTWRPRPHFTVQAGGNAGYQFEDRTITLRDIENPTHSFTRILENELYEWYASLIWEPKPYFTALVGYEYSNRNATFKDNENNVARWVASVNAIF